MSYSAAMSYCKDLVRRLRGSWHWVAAQYVLTLLLILAGLAWTRLPDKHWWQVTLTLLVPLLLVVCVLELEAGTMRAFSDDDGRRVKLVFGAMTLLVWVALFWASWAILDWCDDRIPLWAGYLNSKATAGERATVFTYDHLEHWFNVAAWVLRWIIVPGKMIPYAMASAQWGWWIPFRKMIRLLLNWRWWSGVVLAALLGVVLPGRFFAGLPQGTVTHQIWAVGLKLTASYVLVVGVWVLLLAWAAVLFARTAEPGEGELDDDLFRRIIAGRKWIIALAVSIVLNVAARQLTALLPSAPPWAVRITVPVQILLGVVQALAILVLLPGLQRSMMKEAEKRVRLVWGVLASLIWFVLAIGILLLGELLHRESVQWIIETLLMPIGIIPFVAASTIWGLRIRWRRVLRVVCDWRWWLGAICLGVMMKALPSLFLAITSGSEGLSPSWSEGFKECVSDWLTLVCLVLLLGWAAVLLARTATGGGVTASPLAESGDDGGGNA